ncbi:MAG: InlB B-repeat-containing protein [Oscillospiraceae bacterium]|nr:InlB B-repeat-containing protein [Oscillospiraceae bacterium]
MFKSLLAKLAAMSLLSKTIAVAAAAVIVVGAVAVGLTTQNPSVDPDDQQSGPQQEQLGDVTPDDENGDGSGSGDSDGSEDVAVEDDKKNDDKKKDEAKEEEKTGSVRKYTVKFETGEGSELKKLRVRAGTAISSLDTPYRAEHIFLGWYYDAEHTQPVESDDKVTENLTLYADYLQQQPLETLETVNFASAEDVGTSFAISVVSADTSMTAEEVLAAITADDLTDPDAKDVITVSGSNGNFTVKGNGGFHEGGSYRITLNRDELTFKDQPESAREFNFTVHRDEVMNLTMQSDIKYIPVSQVSNIVNNGATVATLDLALYQTDGNSVSVSELSTGTFTYSGTLAVGDKVCIYEGAIPTARDKNTPKDQLGDMAYLEITGKNENSYTYKNAEAEDVLFMPDVLPMPESADTDDDASTITVKNKYLDYSADFYANMNLDSQTTVDVGDFLAFYTGELGVESGENAGKLTGYGKVTNVAQNGNETTTVSFVTVTWDEVQACMDVYAEESLSGAELLEGVDTEQMESEIEQQAYDSGFAEEAATYLASLALATENFTALSDNMNLEDYKVTLTDGTPVSPETLQLMAGNGLKVKMEDPVIKARVSTKPTHLGNIAGTAADEKGLAISLEVTVVFTIGSEDGDGQLEITVTGSFVEEVGVDFGVSADAVWDWAFIIPYISDIKVSANVDTMNYTGVSFNATMITKENEGDAEDPVGDAMDMANEIKDLLKYMTNNGDSGDEMQDQLVERYSEMLNAESDWIRVVEYNIVEVKKSVPFGIPLINISFSVDFVIDMDASISVGFDFEYIEGKRHVFTVAVKDKDIYSDTIELKEKTYQFCFYSMGRIGLKAGVEMDFSISVISASLGSVGFEAGAGAYTNLYGYFFYELHYTASQGKTQQYSGALLMDVGIYLEAGLKAQALGGRYSAEMKFLDKEWPMYEAGRRDNVLDFATEQPDMPEIVMKQFVRQVQLPDDAFNMDYLDLMTGEAKNAVYNDWNDPNRAGDFRNGANYSIKITNDKFTYDPVTNSITVEPDKDDLKVEGEMVITWNKKPMAFSSKPIQRTVSLYWDNLRDGYMIVPYTNGGSYVPIIVKNYEAKVTTPANPTKLGYTFAGWYTDTEFTQSYTFPELMPATDTSIYAKWEARTDIPYTVEHYLEDFRSGS